MKSDFVGCKGSEAEGFLAEELSLEEEEEEETKDLDGFNSPYSQMELAPQE